MFPHVLLMACGINMAVYCYAAQKEKWQAGLCLNGPAADNDLTAHFHCKITRERTQKKHFICNMIIYFPVAIFKRNSEYFMKKRNGSVLYSGEQTQKGKCFSTNSKSTIVF